MKEVGILNRDISEVISQQGHGDLLLVTDAGFAIPGDIRVIDISLSENRPMVLDLLEELNKYFSVEKMVFSREAQQTNPSYFKKLSEAFGKDMDVELLPHQEFKKKSKKVKAAIRTGDFTAYGNVILVSGAGDRWHVENR